MNETVLGLAVAVAYPADVERYDPGVPLDELRSLVADGAADNAVHDLLEARPALREWVAKVAGDPLRRPPHLQPRRRRGKDDPPGRALPPADRFICTGTGQQGERCNFSWYRLSVSEQPPPACPHDGSPLVEA